jgi:hypothetical protein
MKFRSCFDLFSSPSATKLKLLGAASGRLILPLDGKDKDRGDGSDRFPSTPIPAFPHQGKGFPRCGDTPPFSFSAGERKLMTHFVVRNYFP